MASYEAFWDEISGNELRSNHAWLWICIYSLSDTSGGLRTEHLVCCSRCGVCDRACWDMVVLKRDRDNLIWDGVKFN